MSDFYSQAVVEQLSANNLKKKFVKNDSVDQLRFY